MFVLEITPSITSFCRSLLKLKQHVKLHDAQSTNGAKTCLLNGYILSIAKASHLKPIRKKFLMQTEKPATTKRYKIHGNDVVI